MTAKMHAVQASVGDCFILDFADVSNVQRYWLIDGGPGNWGMADSFKKAANCLFGAMNTINRTSPGNGIPHLDRLIITHNDFDHTFGTYALLSTLKDPDKAEEVDPSTMSPATELKYVSWGNGYIALNKSSPGTWPISHIWFNDKANILKAKLSAVSNGWMDSLIDQNGTNSFRATYSSVTIPPVNDDCQATNGGKLVTNVTATGISNMEAVHAPSGVQLDDVLKHLNTSPGNWLGTATLYRAAKASNTPYYPDTADAWREMEQQKGGEDKSPTNLSSIMFTFTHRFFTDQRILMTGDSTGDILDASLGITDPNDARLTWNIMKVMHHGSSNNSILSTGVNYQLAITNFFKKFKADKYVISSDTWNKSPNPDIWSLQGMVAAFMQDSRQKRLYMTNGCSYTGWDSLFFVESTGSDGTTIRTPTNPPLQVFALKKADVCDYGTVVPTLDGSVMGREETSWLILATDNQFASYFATRLEYFYNQPTGAVDPSGNPVQPLWQSAKGRGRNAKARSILPFLRNLNGSRSKVGKIISRKQLRWNRPPTPATRKLINRLAKKNKINYFKTKITGRSVVRSAHQVAMDVQPITPQSSKTPLTWHDIMVSDLMDVSDLNAEDLEDLPMPTPVPADQVVADGVSSSWVDLPTYLSFLQSRNEQITDASKKLSPDYFATTSYWFLDVDDPTKVETPILAWMLLSILIDNDMATEMMTAFPLNVNGPSSAGINPYAAGTSMATEVDGSLGVWSMLIQNFRALIVIPTTTGTALEVQCFYFELAPPPAELNSISNQDYMTWTVPFTNEVWSLGQVHFEHRGNLRVKMIWPLYLNALTFCKFDGDLEISRGPPVTPLPVNGTMYLQRGDAAAYDIRLVGDVNGKVEAIEILKLLSPTADIAVDVLNQIATKINIPGIDLTKVINQDLVLQDAGIILRQHQPGFVSVSVDDLYGTISTAQVLNLAEDLLPFPTGLKIPQSLPDLTVIVRHASGSAEKVSVAFSQAVGGIGTVALEVGPAFDGQTKFDIWTICDYGVSVNDLLSSLESVTLLPQFQSSSMFTESLLKDLSVPYAHVTLGPSSRYSKGSYAMQNITLSFEVLEDIKIPSDSPVVVLSGMSLDIMYSFAESKTAGASGSLALNGNASVELGGYDAICSFEYNKDAEAIEVDLDEGDDTDNPTAAADLAESQANATSGSQGYVDFSFQFLNQAPRIGDIIQAFLQEPLEAAPLNSLTSNIPLELRDVLDSADFQGLDMRVQNDSSTNKKWEVIFFHVQVRLQGLQDVLNLLEPVGIIFETPILDILIHYPSVPEKKAYEVSLSSWFACANGRSQINASFNSPPTGFVSNPESFSISLTPDVGHPGLYVGAMIEKFTDTTLSALHVDGSVPTEVKDVLDSISIDEAMLTVLKIDNKWKMKFVEMTVTYQPSPPLKPFGNFTINKVQLHLAYDSGVDATPAPDTKITKTPDTTIQEKSGPTVQKVADTTVQKASNTTVQFNADLLIGVDLNISAGFTYDTAAGWTISFKASQSIDLIGLIEKGISDIGLTIPDEIKQEISNILQINIESFYIAYSVKDGTETITFSNDSGSDPNKSLSLFGIPVSNISVIYTKTGGTVSYTVSLSLPTPCQPLADFSHIPLLGNVTVVNGKFALIKGTPAKSVVGNAVVSTETSTQFTFCGTILLAGTDFMKLIHSIIQVDSVDIAILGNGEVTADIPSATIGQDIIGVFKITACFLDFKTLGFGLGAIVQLTANWLSNDPVDATFTLIVMDDGAFGASVSIDLLNEPFGLPGLVLSNMHFSIVWLAEAEEPQSLAAGATVTLKEPGSAQISASFDMSMDELNEANNWFKMDIVNMYLPNMITAMTGRQPPAPFDSKLLLVGFRELHIDLEPNAGQFAFDADFFVAGLEGKASAHIDKTSGIKFAGTMNSVNILGLVQIHGYKDPTLDPFVFLDTTVALNDIIPVKLGTEPAWLGSTLSDQHGLQGTVFALSASLVFLGTKWDGFGLIDKEGLQLDVKETNTDNNAGTSFTISEELTVAINEEKFMADTTFTIDFQLNLPDISVFGISLGSFNGTGVSFTDTLKLTVTYSITDWQNDGMEFFVMVDVNVLGLELKEQLDLDVTITDVSQLPPAIESFIEDKVISYLEDKLDPRQDINKAIHELVDGFNMISSDIMAALSEAGHELEAIASAVASELNMTIDEVASNLLDLGHSVADVATALGSAFNAAPQEILSGLTSAGISIEHAVDAVFDEAGTVLSDGFGFVGSSVVSLATDAVDALKDFGGDLENMADSAISDVGNFMEGIGESVESFFSGGDCEIM